MISLRDRENRLLGQYAHLVYMSRKKLRKGQDIKKIAEDLEESYEFIGQIVDMINNHPDWDDLRIAEKFNLY